MMERRPTFLVLLLGFGLFALVAGREAAFRHETRDQARAFSRALARRLVISRTIRRDWTTALSVSSAGRRWQDLQIALRKARLRALC